MRQLLYLVHDTRGSTVAEAGLLAGFIVITLMSFADAVAASAENLLVELSTQTSREAELNSQHTLPDVAQNNPRLDAKTNQTYRGVSGSSFQPLIKPVLQPGYLTSGREPQS